MNYTELSTAIQDYTQNSETTFKNHINDFIIAAEDKVFMSVQMPALWKSDVDQVCVAAQPEYTLDAGVVDIFSVRVSEGTTAQGTGVSFGPVKYLLRKDYDFLLEAYPGTDSAQTTGVPKYYAVSSASVSTADPTMTIRFGPAPDAVYPFTVDYYGKTTTDSITSGSTPAAPLTTKTWLSVTAPDVLLYGALAQAYVFMKGEPDMIQTYNQKFGESLMMLKNMGEGRQAGDVYVSGTQKVPVQ